MGSQGAGGQAFDGVPLWTLAPPTPREETDPPPFDVTMEIRAAVVGEKVLDGVSLAALGPTEVCRQPAVPLPVFYALQLTPDPLESDHFHRIQSHEDARAALPPRLPRVVVLGCGTARALLALDGVLPVDAAIVPDWTTLELSTANGRSKDVRLVRTPLLGRH